MLRHSNDSAIATESPAIATPLSGDANLVTLITDIKNYLKVLKEDYPATERPKLAALIPIVIWTILALGLVFTNTKHTRYQQEVDEATLFNRYNKESNATHLLRNYFIARTVIIYIIGFLSFPTILYLWQYYPVLSKGYKIHNEDYDNILTNLHTNVVAHLITLEAIEKERAAPDTLLPVNAQTIRTLEATEATLREDQTRLTLIETFTELKNILEILRSEMNRKQRPLTLMFAQPQENRGSVISSAQPDEDLEANITLRQ